MFKSTRPARCPYKQKATGGYKHEPFTSISYSIAIMVCAETPEGSSHPPHQAKRKRWKRRESCCFPPPTIASKYTPFEGVSPRGCPESERKSTVPPRQTPPLPPSRASTPAWGSLNFTGASPPHPHSIAPGSRCPQTGTRAPPDRRVTGESRVRGGGGREPRRGGAARAKFPGV